MVVFNYGSVVFFGFEESEINQRLYDLAPLVFRGTTAPGASLGVQTKESEIQFTEDYTVVERAHIGEPIVLHNDLTILRELDLHSATVIATVMAQTVALDHYEALTDEMLEVFNEMNISVEKTGKLKATEKHDLFKLVASNNSVLIAVLSKLNLLERSDVAWKYPAYVYVWEGLREEFEIEERFSNLKYKLELIQDNTKFFIEIAHANHSNFLEWIIIVLIAAEICIGSMELLELKPHHFLDWVRGASCSIANGSSSTAADVAADVAAVEAAAGGGSEAAAALVPQHVSAGSDAGAVVQQGGEATRAPA
mmetsp:Transcript_13605/g.26918  ORF Transcript_13605/g.26918 Transcript_13605/m.26918 type:complete len:309 (+) Transcript_13605:338-1264(+)